MKEMECKNCSFMLLDATIKKRSKNAAEELIGILERIHGKMEEHVRDA